MQGGWIHGSQMGPCQGAGSMSGKWIHASGLLIMSGRPDPCQVSGSMSGRPLFQ